MSKSTLTYPKNMCQSSFVTPELFNNKGGGIVMMEHPVYKLIPKPFCFKPSLF